MIWRSVCPGRKYLKSGKMPSELRQPHTWRTRVDPFEQDWPQMVKRLRDAPECPVPRNSPSSVPLNFPGR